MVLVLLKVNKNAGAVVLVAAMQWDVVLLGQNHAHHAHKKRLFLSTQIIDVTIF